MKPGEIILLSTPISPPPDEGVQFLPVREESLEVSSMLPAVHEGYLYCHTCREQVTKIGDHMHHALEPISPNNRPCLERPSLIYACYSVFDPPEEWRYSLMSIKDKVDGIIVVEGAYSAYSIRESELEQYSLSAKKIFFDVIDPTKVRVHWIEPPKGGWPSEIVKRNNYFMNVPFLENGDWLLIIDDDEILTTHGPTTLRDQLMFATVNTLDVLTSDDEAKLVKTAKGVGIQIKQHAYRGPADGPSMLRLVRWREGLRYHINHYTMGYLYETMDRKTVFVHLIPEVRIWNIALLHVQGIRSNKRHRQRTHYYAYRKHQQLETPRPSDMTREI